MMPDWIVRTTETVVTTWSVEADSEEDAVSQALGGLGSQVEQGISWPDLLEVYELDATGS